MSKTVNVFRRMSVAGRMYMLVGLMIIFTTIMVFIGFKGFKGLALMINEIHDNGSDGLGYLAGAQDAMWKLRFGVSQYLAIPDEDSRQKIMDESQQWFDDFDKDLKSYAELDNGPETKAALDETMGYYQQYKDARPKWFELMQAGKTREAADFRAQTILVSGAQTVQAFNKLMKLQQKRISYLDHKSDTVVAGAKTTLAGAGIIICLLAIVLSGWISRGILTALATLSKSVDTMAQGDLRMRIEDDSNDELSVLGQHMDKMAGSFSSIIDDISVSVGGVASSVDTLKNAAKSTAEGAREQTSQAQRIAASAEEMNQTILDIARNASTASESSAETMDLVEGGKQVTEITVEIISEVNSASTKLASTIEKLNSSVGEIGDIVTVIKDIADQTNLLALNAAIEAARAGDQGRGFGVVADEVRKLAERTIRATSEISAKIGTVQSESGQTAAFMKDASKGYSKASGNVKNLNNVLNTIVESVQKVRDQITQIAAAVEQQSAASEDVVRNIESTAAISGEMEKMAVDVLGQIEKLSGIGNNLKKDVSGFITMRTAEAA